MVGVVVIGAIVASVAVRRWTSAPSAVAVEAVPEADAIVMFVGGKGERLTLVRRLVDAGVAADVVIPNGMAIEGSVGSGSCMSAGTAEVYCPPLPDGDTRSEARLIADLAAEQGWDDLVVVTSTYHVERARLRLQRCFDGTITTVGAEPDIGLVSAFGKAGHELLGHVEARTLQRSC